MEGETCTFGDKNVPPDQSTQLTQCRADLTCDWLTSTCVAHCQDGASCSADTDCDATKNYKCLGVDSTSTSGSSVGGVGSSFGGVGRCGLLRALGVPCTVTTDCADTLECAPDPTSATRSTCQAKAADGAPCGTTSGGFVSDPHAQCKSGFCDPTLAQCAEHRRHAGLCPIGVA